MAYNGSGTFVRVYNWVTDKANAIKITASRTDTEDDGFATGLSNCITRDGQSTTTARIPFAAGVGLSDGSVGTPALNFTGDTDTGFYRIGANNVGVAANGAKVLDVGTTGLAVTGTVSATLVTGTGMQVGATGVTLGDTAYYKVLQTGNPSEVYDTGDYMIYDRTNNAYDFIIGTTIRAYINAAGIVSAGTVTAVSYVTTSDERLKEDLQPIDSPGAIIDATEAWGFRWKKSGERGFGVMAQHAETVFPYAVHHDEKADTWGVDYSRYVPILLAEVKALRARVAVLEGLIS